MHALKSFQSLRFPWSFNIRSPIFLTALDTNFEVETEHLKEGFLYSIQEILNAVSDFNFNYLAQALEPRLFLEFNEGLRTLQRRGHELRLINQDAPSKVSLYNEELHCGINIDRSLNQYKKYRFPEISRKESRIPVENISFYSGFGESHIILKLDVIYSSALKFIVVD